MSGVEDSLLFDVFGRRGFDAARLAQAERPDFVRD
jgi:hypothetical protein